MYTHRPTVFEPLVFAAFSNRVDRIEALKTFGVTCATLTPSALSVLSPLQLPKLQKLAVAAEFFG